MHHRWAQPGRGDTRSDPRLDEVAPARLLREADLDQAGPQVLAAARAFAAEG